MQVAIRKNPELDEVHVAISAPEIDRQVERLAAVVESFDRRIVGKKEGRTHVIDAADILYVEAVDRRVFVYTDGAVYETALRLYELEDELARCDFVRASKQLIVNFGAVKQIKPDLNARLLLVLENGETVLASRQYASAIKEKLGIAKSKRRSAS